MKEYIKNYFLGLNYKITDKRDSRISLKHNLNQKEVELLFISNLKENLSEPNFDPDRIYLYIIDESNLDSNDFEIFETYAITLPSNASIIIFSEEYIEHTMKDIWMFLNKSN